MENQLIVGCRRYCVLVMPVKHYPADEFVAAKHLAEWMVIGDT